MILPDLAALLRQPAEEPGLAVALLRGGRVVAQHCGGLADLGQGVAIGPRTRFHVVSMSKTFTAAALLRLQAAGRLSLEDPVRRHLPELPDAAAPVRLRHLLSMTAGLHDVLELERLRGVWHSGPGRQGDLLDLACRQTEVSAPPGRAYMYANVNFVLLEEVLRRAAGAPDGDAARRTLLYEPLGLVETAARPHEGVVLPGLAQPYVRHEGAWVRPLDLLGIAGDPLTTSLADLCRWLAALMGGLAPAMAHRTLLADGSPIHYGLGLAVRRYRGLTVLCHSGSQPGWKAHLAWLPERDLGVAVLANREDCVPAVLARSLFEAVLGPAGFPAPLPAAEAAPDVSPGLYVDAEAGEWLAVEHGPDGALVAETLGDPLFLYPDGRGAYRDGDDYRAVVPALLEPEAGGFRLNLGGCRSRPRLQTPVVVDAEAYLGCYENPSFGSRHKIVRQAGGLAIHYGPGFDRGRCFPMQPVGRDLFLVRPAAPGVAHRHLFRFEREGGRVVRARVTMERLKGVVLGRRA